MKVIVVYWINRENPLDVVLLRDETKTVQEQVFEWADLYGATENEDYFGVEVDVTEL